jgi:hypothetical protein
VVCMASLRGEFLLTGSHNQLVLWKIHETEAL